MSNLVHYSFDDIDSVEVARGKLLSAGILPDQISVRVLADEAGPVVGSFVLDTKDASVDHDDSKLDALFSRSNPNEGLAQRAAQWHGSTLLCIAVANPDQQDLIEALLGSPVVAM